MASLFSFEVHTPYRCFFNGQVEEIILTLVDGDIGVLANHSAFTAPVNPGFLKIKDKKGNWKHAFTTEGILEVKEHKTVLVSDACEWPEEIDYERAKSAKERAEAALEAGGMKFETDAAATALKRAIGRIKVREEGKSPH